MKIAIDLDGTLWEYPEKIGKMLNAFKSHGHDVFILTAHDPSDYESDKDLSIILGTSFVDEEHYIGMKNGKDWYEDPYFGPKMVTFKKKFCLENKIDVLIDDTEDICNSIANNTNTLVLQVK